MIRVLLFFIAVSLIAVGAAWLADRPGDLVLTWLGYRIELSLMAAAIISIVVLIVVVFVWSLIRGLAGTPGALGGFLRGRRTEKGFDALTRGMIAIGTGDAREAVKYSSIAGKAFADQPLALLLQAQAAQLNGDRAGAERAFNAMLSHPDTENLGLRGLYIESKRRDDAVGMLTYVEQALKRDRSTEWAAVALFNMQCAAQKWAAALETLSENTRQGMVDKVQARRWRAVLLTAQAEDLEDGDPDRALALAEEANNLAPNLVPAAVLAGSLSGAASNLRKANRILEKAWKSGPHPEIAEAYANVRAGDSVRDRLKRVKSLAQKTPGHPEGAVAVAEAAIDALDWGQAREALEPLIALHPGQRVCSLMAEIDEGEHGDRGRAREWLARAMRAPRDFTWTADGIIASQWAPISPVTGRLDAFEWKVPVERLPGSDEYVEDDSLEPLPEIDIDADEPVDVTPVEDIAEDVDAGNLSEPSEPEEKIAIAPDDPGADGGIVDEDAELKVKPRESSAST
jgi:HemY protein